MKNVDINILMMNEMFKHLFSIHKNCIFLCEKNVGFLFVLVFLTYLYLNKLNNNNVFKTTNFVIKSKRYFINILTS